MNRMLNVGARYAGEHVEYVIEQHSAGEVTFPTGRVVGCDLSRARLWDRHSVAGTASVSAAPGVLAAAAAAR